MPSDHERLATCFTALFPALTPADVEFADPEHVLQWDSVNHINLLLTVGEEFGIEFLPEDYEHLTSFKAILARVTKA